MDVTLFLNHACNMACTYCYNGHKFHRPMSEEIMQRAVEMAFLGKDARISFFGGEPLLEWEMMKQAITHARDLEKNKYEDKVPVRFSMTTNGTLVSKDVLEILRKERFHLVFSLDGNRESHERTRSYANGASTYDLIVENLERAVKAIPSVETITVIDPQNVELIPESFESIMSLGVKNLNFSLNYEAEWTDEQLVTLEHSLDRLVKIYIAKYREGIDFALDLFDSKVITHLKGGYACRDRCKFGKEELCVAPSGMLYPCERLVGEDTLQDVTIGDIWNGPDLQKVVKMGKQKDEPDAECVDCKLRHRCMFWCGCVNYATTGNVGETSGILCKLEQMAIAASDRAAGTLFKEENPMFIGKFYCAS